MWARNSECCLERKELNGNVAFEGSGVAWGALHKSHPLQAPSLVSRSRASIPSVVKKALKHKFGKRTERPPYDLESFDTRFFVIQSLIEVKLTPQMHQTRT